MRVFVFLLISLMTVVTFILFDTETAEAGPTLLYDWGDSFENITKTDWKQNVTYCNGDAFIGDCFINGRNWTKYGMVIDLGAPGEPDDIHIYKGQVFFDEGVYKIWYGGYDGSNVRILYANSTDGVSWNKQGIVIDLGSGGDPDDEQVQNPSLIKDENAPPSERYKIWYTGYDGADFSIIYATSPDGISWTKGPIVLTKGSPGDPDSSALYDSFVTKESDESYRMWYTGFDGTNRRICYAISSDGLTWSKLGVVLDIGAPGTQDDEWVYNPTLIRDQNNRYHLWYAGRDGSSNRIFYATSLDGINWTRQGLAIQLGPPTSYDDTDVSGPSLIREKDNSHKMWYLGRGTNYRLMLANLSVESIEDYHFDFDSSDEGFYLQYDEPNSEVYWDAGNDNVYFKADNSDANDEMFIKPLPYVIDENSGSWTLSGRFNITQQGSWQAPVPLYITNSSTINIKGVPNTIFFGYVSTPSEIRIKYIDSTGTVRIVLKEPAPINTEYRARAIYRNETKNLTLQLLDQNNVVINQSSYLIGTNPSDGFTFEWLGVGVNGYSGAPNPVCKGWTDDITFSFTYKNGTLVSKPISFPYAERWSELYINKTEIVGTYIHVTILNATSGEPIPGFIEMSGTQIDLSGLDPLYYTSIQLIADFTGDPERSPILHDWGVNSSILTIAQAGINGSIDEGKPYVFDGSGSINKTGAWFNWSFDDRTYYNSTNMTPIHIFEIPGTYIVVLNVSYNNVWSKDNCTITVIDTTKPVIDAGIDDFVDEDVSHPFDATGSFDMEGGSILWYNWTFGDGSYDNGTNITPFHSYTIPGIYIVKLNVTDLGGNWNSTMLQITVNDTTKPILDIGSDITINEDSIHHFDASNSYDPEGGSIIWYNWSFGHFYFNNGTDVTPSHTFAIPDIYTVKLFVLDAAGNWNSTSIQVIVRDVTDPVANAGPDISFTEDLSLYVSEQDSYDPEGGTIRFYRWDINASDGLNFTTPDYEGKSFLHIFYEPGQYTITLYVEDLVGNWAIDTLNVTINVSDLPPAPPTGLRIEVPPEGGKLNISWNASTEPDIDEYRLYFKKGADTNYTLLTQLHFNNTKYIHTGLTNNVTYFYYLIAVDEGGNPSLPTDPISGTPKTEILDIIPQEDEPQPDTPSIYDWWWLILLIILTILIVLLLFVVKRRRDKEDDDREVTSVSEMVTAPPLSKVAKKDISLPDLEEEE